MRGGVRTWDGPRPDDPAPPGDPTPLCAVEQTVNAVALIVEAIRYDHRQRVVLWERAQARVCCDACGCLCLADEVCPGCRAARQEAA